MGPELTKTYSSAFGTGRCPRPLAFARDVYATGKWRELSSFVVWELAHRLRLFPAGRYLAFTPHQPLSLDDEHLQDGDEFAGRIASRWTALGLRATRCGHPWKLVYLRTDGGLFGALYPDDNELYECGDGCCLTRLHTFPERIKALFASTRGTLFVCVKGALYRRSPGTAGFERVLNLASGKSFFRHNNAMTEAPGGLLLAGEYGNVWEGGRWKALAFLYSSSDDGATWVASDWLIRQGTNKHVHVVKYSTLLDKLLVADGDNHKKLWVSDGRPERGSLPPLLAVNRFHIQMGGYTSIVESGGEVFFGTDYQGGTNFLVQSADGKAFTRKIVPDPYRRSPIDNMVVRRSAAGSEIWANLPYSTSASKCLLMVSSDGGRTWNRLIEYSRRTHVVWLISSSNEPAGDLYLSIESTGDRRRAVYAIGDHR